MTSPISGNKKRNAGSSFSAEEQALDIISKEAENRESRTNAFLSEARKLRSNERERIRKEEELKEGQVSENGPIENVKVNSIINDNNDLSEKLSKLLLSNGQLDNDKQMLKYQVGHLHDSLSDLQEMFVESKRIQKSIERERDKLKTEVTTLNTKCDHLKNEIRQRNEIIRSNGLTILSTEGVEEDGVESSANTTTAVLDFECLNALSEYSGTLGEKLLKLFNDKKMIQDENDRLRSQLNGYKDNLLIGENQNISVVQSTEFTLQDVEMQRHLSELKLNLRKAEQEITTLHGTVTRLDTQLSRYKVLAETSEKNEEDLKAEKRKLQIEARYAQTRIDELESQNGFLIKRIEKIKLAKNTLDTS